MGPAHPSQRSRRRPRAGGRARRPGPRARRPAWPPAPNPGSPATSASWPPAPPPPCARNTPGEPQPPRPTEKPPGSPTPSRPSHPTPHRGNPELEDMRQAAIRALEIRDEADIMRGLTCGELEARILDAERAQRQRPARGIRPAPAHRSGRSRHLAASCRRRHPPRPPPGRGRPVARQPTRSRTPATRSRQLPLRGMVRRHHEHQGSRREGQSRTGTPRAHPAASRTAAARARERTSEHGRMVAAVRSRPRRSGAALEREHQAVIAAGDPWPPQHAPRPEHEPSVSVAIDLDLGGQAGRFDELLGCAAEAVDRLAAAGCDQKARAQYAARIQRESQAESDSTMQGQVQGEAEAEP